MYFKWITRCRSPEQMDGLVWCETGLKCQSEEKKFQDEIANFNAKLELSVENESKETTKNGGLKSQREGRCRK